MRRAWCVATAWVLWVALCAPAMAASSGAQVGDNLGKLLQSWSKGLFAGIAGLVALVFLLNRRFSELAVFLVACVVVGGFVLAPNSIAGTVRDIWSTLAG